LAADLAIDRQIPRISHAGNGPVALDLDAIAGRGSARATCPREKLSSVGDQRAVMGIDARPRVRGRHQLALYRRHALRRDRQLEAAKASSRKGSWRLDLRQPIGVSTMRPVSTRVGGYGGGDDLALSAQAVAFRIVSQAWYWLR
jgi:hypothetical protein